MSENIPTNFEDGEKSAELPKEIQEELSDIQSEIRSTIRRGRKPNIPKELKGVEDNIAEIVHRITVSHGENKFLSVLPNAQEYTEKFLIDALTKMAKEFQRKKSLDGSFFCDNDKLALITELLIANRDEILFMIKRKKKPPPRSTIKEAERIATYHDSQFINDFLRGSKLIATKLKIPETEAAESFPRSLRLHFAVGNISDPMEGIKKWLKGEITAPFNRPSFEKQN